MILGQVISLVFLVIALAVIAWAIWGHPSRRALKRRMRKGMRKSQRKSIRKNDDSK